MKCRPVLSSSFDVKRVVVLVVDATTAANSRSVRWVPIRFFARSLVAVVSFTVHVMTRLVDPHLVCNDFALLKNLLYNILDFVRAKLAFELGI